MPVLTVTSATTEPSLMFAPSLLQPAHLTGPLVDDRATIPHQFTQFALLPAWHVTRLVQAMPQPIGERPGWPTVGRPRAFPLRRGSGSGPRPTNSDLIEH